MEEINRIWKGMARNGVVIYALGIIDKMERMAGMGLPEPTRAV